MWHEKSSHNPMHIPPSVADWASLSTGGQIRQLEVQGYLMVPHLLDAATVSRLKAETRLLPTKGVDYSQRQRVCPNIQFHGGEISSLIAWPPTIAILTALFGPEIVMMTYSYARSEPGHPGISLHTDGQPYGSAIFGLEGSCPRLVRVLYYLDDLTPDVSPFRVVPGSHLSMHADANPYVRYASHPDEIQVTLPAGSAILIDQRVFHGNAPNTGDRAREMLAIAYRPAWAGPIGEVPQWPQASLQQLPPAVRKLMRDRNHRVADYDVGNKPPDMATKAPGISPGRWH